MTIHKCIILSENTYRMIRENLEKEYRRHHPEMDRIPLSCEKLIYESIRFYCDNTPFAIDIRL